MDNDDLNYEIISFNDTSDEKEESVPELSEETSAAPSIADALKNMKAHTKNKQKRSRVLGLCAFGLSLLAGILLLIVAGNALIAFLNKELALEHIRLVFSGVIISVIISFIALVLSIVTYFLKKQRKGFAITANVISILILLSCGAAVYGYQYMFGGLKQDDKFNQLTAEQLYVKQVESDGEIVRQKIEFQPTTPPEEIESQIEQIVNEKSESNTDIDIEWENLTVKDLPEDVLEKMNSEESEDKSYLTDDHAQILNFALFGLDEIGSSDSIMIFSFDRVHKKLKLISLPRDSYVVVPAWQTYAKLAYPYVWGGAEWAVGTINYNFSMNITEYITVDMSQLEKIIDLVGGVYVDLNYDELNYLRKYPGLNYGRCLLNGKVAVHYSRIRESSATDNEEKRTGRQREVLMSIMQRVKEMSWTDYPKFIRACLEMCTTSFDNQEIMQLCTEALQNDYTIEQYALIQHLDYWGGVLGEEKYFYVVYDLNRASDVLYSIIYEELYISGYKDEE